jgi:hypothetical protein
MCGHARNGALCGRARDGTDSVAVPHGCSVQTLRCVFDSAIIPPGRTSIFTSARSRGCIFTDLTSNFGGEREGHLPLAPSIQTSVAIPYSALFFLLA